MSTSSSTRGTQRATSLLDIDDPRTALLSLYNLNSMPQPLSDTIEATKTLRSIPYEASIKVGARDIVNRERVKGVTNEVIKSMFASDFHPLLKREEISYEILTKNIDAVEKYCPHETDEYYDEEDDDNTISMRELHETRLRAHINRHHYERPPIMVVEGSPVKNIPQVDMKEEQKRYLWNLPCKGNAYLWSTQYYEPEAPMLVERKKEQPRDVLPNAGSVALQNRKKTVEKAKEEIERLKKEAEQQLKEEDMIAENKRELKKKLNAFRRAVYERLLERNDPSIGEIMRCVTEDLVFEFMQQFHGYSMPIDAIIDLLGAQLGSDMIPSSVISSAEVFDQNNDGAIFLKAGIGASYHNPIINRPISPTNTVPPRLEPVSTFKSGLGGGFNTHPSPLRHESLTGGLQPLAAKSSRKPSSNPYTLEEGGEGEGEGEDDEGFERSDRPSYENGTSSNTIGSKIRLAIQAMKEQLIRENLLPSLHVIEKPLTASMITALGKRTISFDEIAKELDRKKSGKSSKAFSIKLLNSVLEKKDTLGQGSLASGRSKQSGGSQQSHASKLGPMSDSLVSNMSKPGTSTSLVKEAGGGGGSVPGSPQSKATPSCNISTPQSLVLSLNFDEHSMHQSGLRTGPPSAAVSRANSVDIRGDRSQNAGSPSHGKQQRKPASSSSATDADLGQHRSSLVSRSSFVSTAGKQPSLSSAEQKGSLSSLELNVHAFSPDAVSQSRHNSVAKSSLSRVNSISSSVSAAGQAHGTDTAGVARQHSISESPAGTKKPLITLHPQLEEMSRSSGSSRSLLQLRSQSTTSQSVAAMLEAFDSEPVKVRPKPPIAIKTKETGRGQEQWDPAVRPYASLAEATLISSGLGGVATSGSYGFVDRMRLIKGKEYKMKEKKLSKMTSRAQK